MMVGAARSVSKNPLFALPIFLWWGLLSSFHVRNHNAKIDLFLPQKWIASDKVS